MLSEKSRSIELRQSLSKLVLRLNDTLRFKFVRINHVRLTRLRIVNYESEIRVCSRVNKTLQTPLTNLIIEKIYSEEGYDDHKFTVEKLSQIVIELIKSNNKLRNDVKELKRWVQVKKKKIVVID